MELVKQQISDNIYAKLYNKLYDVNLLQHEIYSETWGPVSIRIHDEVIMIIRRQLRNEMRNLDETQ
jgi:hypothetical protein